MARRKPEKNNAGAGQGPNSIICVDRDTGLASRLGKLFPNARARVLREPDVDRVIERFESDNFDVLIVTDAATRGGAISGIDLIDVISAKSPATQILFLVQPGEIRLAMSALKAGTYQYARLPISDEELRLLVETAFEKRPRYGQNLLLKDDKRPASFASMIGRSRAMQAVYRQIRQASTTDIPVLLLGETGTGKDLAAQAIHQQSSRSPRPYVPVHLGALPPELVASELFGHEKGAFTGAVEQRVGMFETANGGTIFLDEISTLDEKVQISLLRLLEQKRFHRIGGRRTVSADVRLIAASNEDLEERVRCGTFREDLFFRLDVFHIILPPLRERHGDIPPLIDEFLKRYNLEFQKNILGIAPECVALLESYDWPGNVREIKNVIQRAVLVCPGEVLLPEHLPPRFRTEAQGPPTLTIPLGTPLKEVERRMLLRALEATGNNRKRAAALLGISRRALYNKLHRFRII